MRNRGGYKYLPGLLLAMAIFLPALAFGANCRQALALGLDISGSVDQREYRLQLDGLAAALLDPSVQNAFLAMPDANVRVFVYEWAGQETQRQIIGWTEISHQADLFAIAQTLANTKRAPHRPATALGMAMLYGGTALATQPECWRHTLDISGDGGSNDGPRPRDVKSAAVFARVTINALVIGPDVEPYSDITRSQVNEISDYYRSEVILGPDAFVEQAIEFVSYQKAMTRKLLKELQTRAVGNLVPDHQ